MKYNSPYIKNPLRIISLLFLLGIFFSNALLQIASVLFLPFVIYITIINTKEKKLQSLEKLILLLFFSSLLSIYLSPAPSVAVKNIINHSILLAIIPLSYLVEHDELISINLLGKMISVFALLTAAFGILRYVNGAERAFGFFAGYYTLACILAFTIPITFAFIFYSKDVWKYFAVISTLVQAAALWFTFTRSALLGIVFGSLAVIIILFFHGNNSKQVRKKIILASILFLCVVLILLFTTTDSRLNPLMLFSNPDLSSGRNEIYNDAYNTFTSDFKTGWKNIFFGHGLESRIILFPKSLYTSWESDYIETFISQGLIGLLIVLLIYYKFFRQLFQLFSKVRNSVYSKFTLGLIASGISFWIISFFSSQLVGRNSSAYFVVLYSLIILIEKNTKEKQREAS